MLKRIPLNQIMGNPNQPRKHFDADKLNELAMSISQNGLKQPITVRPIPETEDGIKFEIVMGERRFRAHKVLAGIPDIEPVTDILCHVRKMDDQTMHIDAILENLQREEVSPIEEAEAFDRAMTEFGYTVEELAQKLGIKQHFRITERVQLLGLTADNRDLLRRGVISNTQAFHMAPLSPNGQQKMLQLIRDGLVKTNQAAQQAAHAIKVKEDQAGMFEELPPQRKKVSAAGEEAKLDQVGAALNKLLKDGQFHAPDNIDINSAERCKAKAKALRSILGQIERELERATSISAVAA